MQRSTGKTLHDMMESCGVLNHPDWFSKINLLHWPMPHQMEMIRKYQVNFRYLDASQPGTGKTYPAQTHAILMASLGNKVAFMMPPKLIDQFIQEMHDYFEGIGSYLKIAGLNVQASKKLLLEKLWDKEGWPDILVMSYDAYRQYNDKSHMKNIGRNLWKCRKPLEDGSYEYLPYFKEDGNPLVQNAQPYTKDGRVVNNKGRAKNNNQMRLRELGYHVLFADEGHALCGIDSLLSQSFAEMSSKLGDEVALYIMTGTPVPTKLHDSYGLIRLINPGAYMNKAEFMRRHCITQEVRMHAGGKSFNVKTITGYNDTEAIYAALWKNAHRVMLRDVTEMPEPIINEVRVTLSGRHRKLYKQLVNDHVARMGEKVLLPDSASELRHTALQFISCPGQYDPELADDNELAKSTADLVETISPDADRKIIIFAYYQKAIEELAERYKHLNPGVVYGGSSRSSEDIRRFKEDPNCHLLIIQWIAGGAGLNLQVANYLIFYEIPTSPKDALQAIARADRKGQLKMVHVYFMRVMSTISDRNFKNLLKNEESNNRVVGDTKGLLHELLGAA